MKENTVKCMQISSEGQFCSSKIELRKHFASYSEYVHKLSTSLGKHPTTEDVDIKKSVMADGRCSRVATCLARHITYY